MLPGGTLSDEAYSWMGATLFVVQGVEAILGETLTVAFPKGNVLSLADLEADSGEHRRKTIGQLVTKLQRRAELHPDVAGLLSSFLDKRNQFTHRLCARFDFGTDTGREEAIQFCKQLMAEASRLFSLLMALYCSQLKRIERLTAGAVAFPWDGLPRDLCEEIDNLTRLEPLMVQRRRE